jgi:hypothetical protein
MVLIMIYVRWGDFGSSVKFSEIEGKISENQNLLFLFVFLFNLFYFIFVPDEI